MKKLVIRLFVFLALLAGCTTRTIIPLVDAGPDAGRDPGDAGFDSGLRPHDAGPPPDSALNPDAACASMSAEATVEQLPVDIIWMVDNSTSMQPAIEQVQ